MKLPTILVLATLGLVGCKESKSGRSGQILPGENKAVASPPVQSVKMTPEQIASTVRVRIISGGLPKYYTGALLPDRFSAETTRGWRIVLARLPGWTKAKLASVPGNDIIVLRNRADVQGYYTAESYNLVGQGLAPQLDERTGVATLIYRDNQAIEEDVGYKVNRGATDGVGTQAVASWVADTGSSGVVPRQPLNVEMGTFESRDGKRGTLRFSASNAAKRDQAPLCINASGQLIGFFDEGADGQATLIPLGGFLSSAGNPPQGKTDHSQRDKNLSTADRRFEPTAIGFGETDNFKRVRISVQAKINSPELRPRSVMLQISELKADASAGADASKEQSIPTTAKEVIPLQPKDNDTRLLVDSDLWTGDLGPAEDGPELTYRMQFAWSMQNANTPDLQTSHTIAEEPLIFGPSLLVRIRRENGVVISKVEGMRDLNDIKSANDGRQEMFPLEAPVRDLKEIAGGREVLLQFDGPPFWKRFSLTRNAWLPLPPMNLTDVYVTGNATALFVLDRGAAEVRRFALADLSQTASVKLPTDKEYIAILAGSNSERAPVHVLMKHDLLSLDADSLQRRGLASSSKQRESALVFDFSVSDRFQITGDGLSVASFREDRDRPGQEVPLTYMDDVTGLLPRYDDNATQRQYSGVSVAAAYRLGKQAWLASFATRNNTEISTGPAQPKSSAPGRVMLSPNSPLTFNLIASDNGGSGRMPPKIQCFGYSHSTSFAEMDAPELFNIHRLPKGDEFRWVTFDPYSLRLGVPSTDRKTLVVHSLVPKKTLTQPLLLNWPDTALTRGGEFRFKPLMLGEAQLSVELAGNKEPTPVSVADGTVSFRVAKNELASLLLLNLKLTTPGGASSYPIPVHVFGPQPAFIAPLTATEEEIAEFGDTFLLPGVAAQDWRALPVSVHELHDPMHQVLGPVAGHLILVTKAHRVDFFSLEKRQVTGSMTMPEHAWYFAGADALFEYDTSTRILTRMGVPDGRSQQSMTVPDGLKINAVSVGVERGSPLLLVIDQIQKTRSARKDNPTEKEVLFNRKVLVLDSTTLLEGSWAKPRLLGDWREVHYALGMGSDLPVHIPSSHDGLIVSAPDAFIANGRQKSLAIEYPEKPKNEGYIFEGDFRLDGRFLTPTGSIAGMIAADSTGTAVVGGVRDKSEAIYRGNRLSPCGRYRLVSALNNRGYKNMIEIRTLENNRPLFRVGGFPLHRQPDEVIRADGARQYLMLGDNGPLAMWSAKGRHLQLVELDIPRIAREIHPSEFHVTSQSAPFVMEGAALEYQITVNNPDAVAGYRLRAEAADISVTPQGLLRYTAPAKVDAPTRVTFSVEILGKDDRTVLHQFPVFLLPTPPAEPKPAPVAPPPETP